MKCLVLADRPPSKPIKELLADNPGIQLIITLGDLYFYNIQDLAEIGHIPKIGVYGNHCDGRYMETLGITNLHLSSKTVSGISFFGYQGCVKYKDSPLQSTQEYCKAVMKGVPRHDVLIAHCPPRGLNDNDDPAHYGFDGLREYVDRCNPKYVLHGHTYDFGKFVDKYKDTKIIYVHQEMVIELELDDVTNNADAQHIARSSLTPQEWLTLSESLSSAFEKEMAYVKTLPPLEQVEKLPHLLCVANTISAIRGQDSTFLDTRPDGASEYRDTLYKNDYWAMNEFYGLINGLKSSGYATEANARMKSYLLDFWFEQ